ncbi:unnamed protein product [marine sediment metagenome]|uniref:Uncharacterized protein n=1 Tax=marine sediment metagenome TaxID=412755 RepID=X1GRX2_9ZZZZ
MAMNLRDQLRLKADGYLPWEITEFATAKAPDGSPQVIDINSETWKQARTNRRHWIAMLKSQVRSKYHRNLSQIDINRLVDNWYKQSSDRTPWDLIKAEYQPHKGLTDYQTALKARAVASKRSLYSRRVKTQGKPYG